METMEEINDLYHLKDKIGDFLIEHHYDTRVNSEKESNTERLMETLNKMWDALDEYRDKHIKQQIDMENFEIIYEELSDCCGATIYDDIEMCSECKEYCEPFKED